MIQFDPGLALGACVLLLNFLAWRFVKLDYERVRLGIRAVLFLALTYVLWLVHASPFRAAPWPDDPERHVLAVVLELIWWLQTGQLVTALLGKIVLPERWNRERLFRDVFRALVFMAVGIAAVGYVLDLPVRGLLVTSGALAIIFGLAVQSTLSDVFSGVVLNTTQPFRLGDIVTIGETEGEVVQSNWRATSLLNSQGNIVTVPNSVAAKANIVNHSQPPRTHGFTITLRLSLSARPAHVIKALEEALAGEDSVLKLPKPSISAKSMGRRSTEYEILVYIETLSNKSAIRNKIIDLAHRHLTAHGIYVAAYPNASALGSMGQLLREIEMFQTLDQEQMAYLESSLVRTEFAVGEVVYQVGPECPDEKRSLHIIATGVAALFTPHEGKQMEVRRLSPGEAVGRSAILAGVSTSITLYAVTPVVTVRLDKESLSPILQKHPEIAQHMLSSLMQYQANHAARLDEMPDHTPGDEGILHWLLGGMKRLHRINH